MRFCYIDEAGCPGHLPSATSKVQPVLIIVGLILEQENLYQFTLDWLQLKKRFFPGLASGNSILQYMQPEIKGSELKKDAVSIFRKERRAAIGFLDHFFNFLETHEVKIVGRIWVKGIASSFDGKAVYTSSIQSISECFQNLLVANSEQGFIIADSRTAPLNQVVSHSIFTQKFKFPGDDRLYPNIGEMPVFGHSNNHAGLQCADILCSALLNPMAVSTYCEGHVKSIHVKSEYAQIAARYAHRLKPLLHRYQDNYGKIKGGITVSDAIGHKSSSRLFQSLSSSCFPVERDFTERNMALEASFST